MRTQVVGRVAWMALWASVTVLGLCGAAAALDVTLNVPETAGVARTADPCRTGVPLVPGSVTDATKLRVVDDKGNEVAAQFRVINRRPAGDVEWVCVDFLADVPANGKAVYHLTDGGPGKAVAKPVTVDDGADAITLVTGPLKLVVPKKSFAGLGEVWLDRDGGGRFEQVAKGGALVVKGMDGKTYRSTTDLVGPVKVAVEESGPLHAVVRVDGEIKVQSADGKQHYYPTYNGGTKQVDREGVKIDDHDGALGFTVRIHVWKDQSWVRSFVTMRNLNGQTNNWTEVKINFGDYFAETCQRKGNYLVDAVNMDLDLATTANLKYRIGGGLNGSEVHSGDLVESQGSVVLYQDSSASWMWQVSTGKVYDERLKKNIEMLRQSARDAAKAKGEDPEAAAAKAPPYYEYAGFGDYVSKELLCKRDGCSFMGYRLYKGGKEVAPGSNSSFADLGKEAGEGLRAPGWIEVDDGKVSVTAGCRWFWQMFPKSLELTAPGKLSVGLWSQYWSRGHVFEGKIHKTHELVYDFRPSGKGLDGNARFLAFTQRLVGVPDARHNLASRAYGDFMLPNPDEWPNYEKSAMSAVVSCLNDKVNPGQSSCMEIEREKCENYDVWKFGDSNKDNWHYFGQYQELDVPYCLIIHYARTGDIRFFRMAEEVNRMLLDIPAHGGGYGHQMGEPSHYYAYGPLLYADVAAEPFLRDAVDYSHNIVHPGPWHLRSFAVTLWSNWALRNGYDADRDKHMAGIKTALDWWDKAYNKQTHVIGGFARDAQIFMLGMGGDAMGRYCETFPEDKEHRQQLVDGYKEWMEHLKAMPDRKNRLVWDKTTANGFAYATRFSGDQSFLDFAAENLVKDEWFPINYRTGVCSAKNWSETMSSQRLVQVFLHDVDKKKHPEKYKDLP